MAMMRRIFLATVFSGFVIGAGCNAPATTNDDPGGGGNTADGGSGDTGDQDQSDDGMARLTLRITAPDNGTSARIYGVVNDGPQNHMTLYDRVPQSDFRLIKLSNTGSTQAEQVFEFEAGTQIALVAVEEPGFVTATPPPDTFDTVPLQFQSWSGDFVNADIGDNAATMFFDLDADRTIEAEYAAMTPIFITAEGGGPHSNVLIRIDDHPFVVAPEPDEQQEEIDDLFPTGVNASDVPTPHVLWGFYRDGTVLSLEVMDYVDNKSPSCDDPSSGLPCFVWVAWTGDCLGSGKICDLTFGEANDANVIFQDSNN